MLKLFKNLTKKDILYIVFCIVLVVFQVWLELRMPDYMSTITRLVETEGSRITDILINGGYMMLCAFGSLVSAIIVGYFSTHLASNFQKHYVIRFLPRY